VVGGFREKAEIWKAGTPVGAEKAESSEAKAQRPKDAEDGQMIYEVGKVATSVTSLKVRY
jgi:hypothetical protein